VFLRALMYVVEGIIGDMTIMHRTMLLTALPRTPFEDMQRTAEGRLEPLPFGGPHRTLRHHQVG
jgi:hypothetical protein